MARFGRPNKTTENILTTVASTPSAPAAPYITPVFAWAPIETQMVEERSDLSDPNVISEINLAKFLLIINDTPDNPVQYVFDVGSNQVGARLKDDGTTVEFTGVAPSVDNDTSYSVVVTVREAAASSSYTPKGVAEKQNTITVRVTDTDLNVSLVFDPDAQGGGGSTRTFRSPVEVLAAWTQAVDGFVLGKVSAVWHDSEGQSGTLDNFRGSNGSRLFRFTVNLPTNSEGSVDISIPANAAAVSGEPAETGPLLKVTETLNYNTIRATTIPPSLSISTPDQNPYRGRLYVLRFVWTDPVEGFDLMDVKVTGATLSNFTKVNDQLWTAHLQFPAEMPGTATVTVRADAASSLGGLGPKMKVSVSIPYNTRGPDKNIPGTVTLCEETYTFANNPHFSGAFCNVLEMLVHNGYVYFIVQFIRDRGSSPVNFLAWETRGASALFRVPIAGGNCQRLTSFDDVLSGARSLCVFDGEVHYFRGSHYLYQFADAIRPASNADWQQQVGEIWKLENGMTPKLVGKTGRIRPEPTTRPGEDASPPDDGTRGGTVSPLVAADGELYYLTGSGDTRELGANFIANKTADDIRNWTLSKLTETLETRIPVLETNGHPGWEHLKQLAQLTRSRLGFRGEEFRFEPTAARTAKIKTPVTDAATSLPLKDFSRLSPPSSGTVFIQGELMTYTGIRSGTLTGVARGAYETTPDGYQVDDTVVFVDAIIDEYLSLSLSNDPSRIYNIITIAYGDGQQYTVKDDASIAAYGRKQLSLRVPLGSEQTVWAESLANDYLADFKDPKTMASLTIEANYDIQIGDVVFVEQVDRAHLFGCGQVVEVRQTLSGQQRNQAQTTGVKVVLI